MNTAVIDALARATGERYSTFDVVGAGPRIVCGIAEKYFTTDFYTYEKAIQSISKLVNYDLLLISAMSSDYGALEKLVTRVRSEGFRGLIVVGGPISFEYQRILRNLPVDFIVVGEGEIPLEKLFSMLHSRKLDLQKIPAIAYMDKDTPKLTSPHIYTPVEVLNSVKPWTRVDKGFEYPQIYRFYVEVVRGCSNYSRPMVTTPKYKCIKCQLCRSPVFEERVNCPVDIPPGCGFCSVPYMFGPARSRSIESIKTEVEELIAHGARRIVLSAPDFLDYMRERLVKGLLTDPCNPPANTDAIENLLNTLTSIEEIKSGKVVLMIENIKACLVTEEVGRILGRYLKETTVHIGLETGCSWFNEKILGKPISTEHVVKATKILSEYGLRPYVYIMYGVPFATREVYVDTLSVIEKLKGTGVEKITLYKYTPLPATAFEELKPEIRGFEDLIRRLKNTIEQFNLANKRRFINSEIEVWLVESKGKIYGYPVRHGPVVFIERGRKFRNQRVNGCLGVVRVVDIAPRYLKGVLVSILECPGGLHKSV